MQVRYLLEQYFLLFKSMVIFQDILILLLELLDYLVLNYYVTLITLIFLEILRSFGVVGIFLYRLGLKITYIFRLVEAKAECGCKLEIQ